MAATVPEDLLAAARGGDRGALARLISIIERGGEEARQVGRAAHGLRIDATTIGITGAPGAGKSTLTSALLETVRAGGDPIAVLAIDPSSPFSGGALLGDRVRMGEHALDDGVFIRSMATRGHLGGLAVAAPEAVRVLAAAGYPWVILETVGVGQVEIDVMAQADTTVVVVTPGWGDAVQANKAGLMEIADVFVINKADRPGANDTRRDLENMLEMTATPEGGWRPPIVETVAAKSDGVDLLWSAVADHKRFLEKGGLLAQRRARRLSDELRSILVHRLEERATNSASGPTFDELHADVVARRLDPYSAADRLLDSL